MDESQKVIDRLKEEYGEVFSVFMGGKDIIFRPLSVREYSKSLDVALRESSADAEEYVINQAVEYPPDFDLDNYMIGEVSALADNILEQSGFSTYESCVAKLNVAREKASEVVSFMIAMILASEQGYQAEELRSMTFAQIAEKAAMAERIFEIKQQLAMGGEVTLEIRDPSDTEEVMPQKTAKLSPEEWEAIKNGEFVNPEKASTIGAASVADPVARKLHEALQ